MENGKRIEFNGVAKIVILTIVILTITGITGIEAIRFSAENCPDCTNSGFEFVNVDDFGGLLFCDYCSSNKEDLNGYYIRASGTANQIVLISLYSCNFFAFALKICLLPCQPNPSSFYGKQ